MILLLLLFLAIPPATDGRVVTQEETPAGSFIEKRLEALNNRLELAVAERTKILESIRKSGEERSLLLGRLEGLENDRDGLFEIVNRDRETFLERLEIAERIDRSELRLGERLANLITRLTYLILALAGLGIVALLLYGRILKG